MGIRRPPGPGWYQLGNPPIYLISWRDDGQVAVPVGAVAEKWIEYYWPLIASPRFLPQTQGETPDYKKPVAFRKDLQNFISQYSGAGGLSAYINNRNSGNLSSDTAGFHRSLITKIRNTIVKGPVYYAGGRNSEDKPFAYDTAARSILISADLWREFVLLGHWIRDSILIHWAEESQRMSGGEWRVSEVLDLLLKDPDPERNVSAARNLYTALKSPECVWTGRTISSNSLDIDHAIPWSLWRDNSLWNLLPATSKANSAKSDKLPTYHWILALGP